VSSKICEAIASDEQDQEYDSIEIISDKNEQRIFSDIIATSKN